MIKGSNTACYYPGQEKCLAHISAFVIQEQEKKQRIRGIDAQRAHIKSAKAIARILRSSLGPNGMDKLLQGPDGDVCISKPLAPLCELTLPYTLLYQYERIAHTDVFLVDIIQLIHHTNSYTLQPMMEQPFWNRWKSRIRSGSCW